MPPSYITWIELLYCSLFPNVSFFGHLSGILAGYTYIALYSFIVAYKIAQSFFPNCERFVVNGAVHRRREESKRIHITTQRRTISTSMTIYEEEDSRIVCSRWNIPSMDSFLSHNIEMGCCCSSPEPYPTAADPYMLHNPTINNFHFYTDNPECIVRIEKIIEKVQNPSVTVNQADSSPLFFDTPVAS